MLMQSLVCPSFSSPTRAYSKPFDHQPSDTIRPRISLTRSRGCMRAVARTLHGRAAVAQEGEEVGVVGVGVVDLP